MKTNLPGVSYSTVEENIIWLSIVGMNEQGFATDGLFFFLIIDLKSFLVGSWFS